MRYISFLFVYFFSLFSLFKNSLAAGNDYDDYYTRQYSYNIFSATTWDMSPYVFGGYSFSWIPYTNNDTIKYGNMLRNGHHGFILGAGVTINRNWSFGLSFQRITRRSELRDSYAVAYPEISSIKSEILLSNIDTGLRIPCYKNTDLQVLTGLNIISSNISNDYRSGAETVSVNAASSLHKIGFGANIGLGLTYRIFAGVHLKVECRRLFVLTKNSIRDSWIINTGIGINF